MFNCSTGCPLTQSGCAVCANETAGASADDGSSCFVPCQVCPPSAVLTKAGSLVAAVRGDLALALAATDEGIAGTTVCSVAALCLFLFALYRYILFRRKIQMRRRMDGDPMDSDNVTVRLDTPRTIWGRWG